MSNGVSTLLLRNLSEVFAEIDPVRRRKAIDEVWHEDGVFYDPNSGPYRGRDEIDRIAGKVKAIHPSFRYPMISAPEEIGDERQVRWVSGTPGKPPEYAGTDFVVARDSKIAAPLYVFRQTSLAAAGGLSLLVRGGGCDQSVSQGQKSAGKIAALYLFSGPLENQIATTQ